MLDLHKDVEIQRSQLAPRQQYGHRLVIDLIDKNPPLKAEPIQLPVPGHDRDVVIAIDAGHGGEDVGAIGARGSYEKDIVMAVAHELASLINARRGMQAVLVRDGDYYIGLRKRTEIARMSQADLLISLHADAFRDPRVAGSSVYVLSQNGASSEAARWLAESENDSDLIGGVALDDKDEVLRSVLIDLSQTASLDSSIEAAGEVLAALKKLGKVHKRKVEHAGFVVLKSPDVPSLLIEMAFISNPAEEKKLQDDVFRRRLATAIRDGVMNYFNDNAPPGTVLAARNHTVVEGDTISAIARRYEIRQASLKLANNLRDDHLSVGKVLQIP